MECPNLVRCVVENPYERLVLRVSTCMLNEPKHYQTADEFVETLRKDLSTVEELEPSFIPKLAFYSRQHLNLRSVSNFILAWSANKPRTHQAFREFFTSAINLPSDLMDFIEKYQQEIGSPAKLKLTTFLQKLIGKKLRDFNIYQIGKYCSEAKRKRELVKGSKKLSMKKLIMLCHIKEPKLLVDSILGRKYPKTPEAFVESGYGPAEKFDPELAGTRLKVNTPYTWETELSKKGNKAECWEELVKQGKLPYMAMLRNIRNLLITGVDTETHIKAAGKLNNPEAVQNSRLFPFRYLTAYESINIDLEHLRKLKVDPEYQQKEQSKEPEFIEYESEDEYGNIVMRRELVVVPEPPQPVRSRGRFVRRGRARVPIMIRERSSNDESGPTKKRKIVVPKEVPTQEILDLYKNSIDDAIKLATSLNVDPIRGKTVIFCDCSGSMSCPISSKTVSKYSRCQDVGFLFGLMLRSVSEDCEVYLFSSTKRDKCWLKLDLVGDNIFELLEHMNDMSATLGGGTEFPFDWFEEALDKKKWFDNFIIFTDMMISEMSGYDIFQRSQGKYTKSFDIVNAYREQVNPDMRYISCDLAGHSQQLKGAKFEKDFKNLLIGGYSDSILQFISTSGLMQSEFVRNCKPMHKKSN